MRVVGLAFPSMNHVRQRWPIGPDNRGYHGHAANEHGGVQAGVASLAARLRFHFTINSAWRHHAFFDSQGSAAVWWFFFGYRWKFVKVVLTCTSPTNLTVITCSDLTTAASIDGAHVRLQSLKCAQSQLWTNTEGDQCLLKYLPTSCRQECPIVDLPRSRQCELQGYEVIHPCKCDGTSPKSFADPKQAGDRRLRRLSRTDYTLPPDCDRIPPTQLPTAPRPVSTIANCSHVGDDSRIHLSTLTQVRVHRPLQKRVSITDGSLLLANNASFRN